MKSKAGKPNKSGCMETPYAEIYYEVYGEGTPLFMLHGNAGSHKEFLSYTGQMCGKYQVILMDSRGHGRSLLKTRAVRQEFTASDMAEDVKRLMDYLHLRKGILLGFSDGANTALEFAVRHPDMALAVVSVSGNAQPAGLWLPAYLFISAKYHMAGFFRHFCSLGWVRKKAGRSQLFSSLLLHSPSLTEERLNQIKTPVLLIAGTLDIIKVSHTKWMARNIPGSRLVLVRGGTHGAFFRRRSLYLNCIMDFLDYKREPSVKLHAYK